MSADRRRQLRLLRSFFPFVWRMRRRYRVPSAEPSQPYYIYYPSGEKPDQPWTGVTFDERGVIVGRKGYNPVTIAQYALYSHERSLRNIPGSHDAFRAQIDYLVDNQRGDGAYVYDDPTPQYGITEQFTSAMAQGVAASALARAFIQTSELRYRDAAVRAIEPLKRDVCEGGVSYIRDGDVFFEELATEQPCHILNGHLFAAFGVWDLQRIGLADQELTDLHAAAIETLLRWLPHYEDGRWSYYQLAIRNKNTRHYAHISYHHLHIAQLHVYAVMTGREEFREVAHRWEQRLERPDVRARVWLDSAGWLFETFGDRVGLMRLTPWRPMMIRAYRPTS